MVVVFKPLIQILLELFGGSLEFVSEKLVKHSAVESFYKSVGPGSSHLGSSVLDIGKFQEDLIGMDHRPAAVPSAVIREDMLNHEAMITEKGQYPVI